MNIYFKLERKMESGWLAQDTGRMRFASSARSTNKAQLGILQTASTSVFYATLSLSIFLSRFKEYAVHNQQHEGAYKAHGFINPFLAAQTGFSDDDLQLLFTALENAFQFDQSAARPAGSMAPRALLIFRHEGTDTDPSQRAQQAKLGCAPSHALFDRLKIESFEGRPSDDGKPPRKFTDYANRITFDGKPLDEVVKPGESKPLPQGVTLIRRI
jgi:Cas7 group CRISPR-associated protein Csh2